MAASAPPLHEGSLPRVLGPMDATCVVIGAIVGVGIFFTPSTVAQTAGSATMALAAWMVGGAIALAGAPTFATLGNAYNSAGGQYEILRDAYGTPIGFLFVFCNASAVQAGAIAIIALVCAKNLGIALYGAPLSGVVERNLAVVLTAALALTNVIGVRWGAAVQNLTVASKILTMLLVTGLALFAGPDPSATRAIPDSAAAQPAAPSLATLFAAVVPCLFAYGGWQHALWMAGEVRAPKRNVPLAILLGVVVVVVTYLLVNWAYLDLLGYSAVAASSALASDAVAAAWPATGKRLIGAAVAASAFGVLNAQLLSGPRLIYRMAADGHFWRVFATTGARLKTPWAASVSLAALGLILLALSGVNGVEKLLNGVVFLDSVFFLLTGAAVFVLLRRGRIERGVARALGFPIAPALFVLGEIGVLAGSFVKPDVRDSVLFGLGWIVVGVLLFALCFRRASTAGPGEKRAV